MTKAAELAKMGEVLTNSQIGGRRNIVYNGAMNVAQRSTSVSDIGGSSGYFTVDRQKISVSSTAGRLTMSQVAVTDLPGFANALKLDCTTADTSIAAGEFLLLHQDFEGQDLQQMKKGTSDAEKVTVSFYVKGNASATYVVELFDNDNDRSVSQSFSVTTSWNRVILTFPADTTGTFDDDNASSLRMFFWLHAGSTYSGGSLGTTWHTTAANRAAGISSFFDSTDREFFLTGLQMEIGSQATPFEHRSFGEELALCQRYFYQAVNGTAQAFGMGTYYASNLITMVLDFPTTMRAAPSVTVGTGTNYYVGYGNGQGDSFDTWDNVQRGGLNYIALDVTGDGADGTAGHGVALATQNASAFINVDAELQGKIMNIESAKYGKDFDGNNSCIVAMIDGIKHLISLDPNNRHYQAIQEWVKEGNKIEDADQHGKH